MARKFEKTLLCLLMCGYLLGISNGRLALWEGDDPEPRYVFSVEVRSLPVSDQLALRRGIPVESEQALLKLLQDYL